MDTALMRTFVAVLRAGSFAAVARERGTAPSSVSRAVAALEDTLGARLLQRTTRRLAPTEAGRRYFERIEPLLEELEAAEAAAAGGADVPRGTLRLTAPLTFAQLHLVPLLPRFAERYPEISFELVLTDTLVDLVAERIDVAIRIGRIGDSSMVASRLCDMRHTLCASPAYVKRRGAPRHPSDLSSHDVLRFPVPGVGAVWRFRRGGRVVEVPVSPRLGVANGLALRIAAEAGMGITLLPHWNVARQVAAGALVKLLPEWAATVSEFDGAAWLLYPSRAFLPAKVRVFVDWVKAELRDGRLAEAGSPTSPRDP
jgi:DNA-binding transcriptional LysR family regulator